MSTRGTGGGTASEMHNRTGVDDCNKKETSVITEIGTRGDEICR